VGYRRQRAAGQQENPPMRIYIIGSDGIALGREAPAAVNDGEIVVASKEELHAAPLSGKRLLALWNALPGVDKRRKVGDREALIDELWSAIERLPDPEPRPDPKRPSKQDVVIAMLRQPEGATVDEVASVTGWPFIAYHVHRIEIVATRLICSRKVCRNMAMPVSDVARFSRACTAITG
jgi:hypothetical protein